jgi:hypothetical protein
VTLAKLRFPHAEQQGSWEANISTLLGDPTRSRVENTIMDGVRLSDALRCRANDPPHSNSTSEFQQAANLSNA